MLIKSVENLYVESGYVIANVVAVMPQDQTMSSTMGVTIKMGIEAAKDFRRCLDKAISALEQKP